MENLNPILGNVAYMQQWPQMSKIGKLEKFSEDIYIYIYISINMYINIYLIYVSQYIVIKKLEFLHHHSRFDP